MTHHHHQGEPHPSPSLALSLLRFSLTQRLGLAAASIALIWAAVLFVIR